MKAPEQEQWSALSARLVAGHRLAHLWANYNPTERHLSIDQIVVEKEARSAGHGTAAMREVLNWADANGVTVSLTPAGDLGTPKAKLVAWYRKLGFVPNKGRARNFYTRDTMIRAPRSARSSPPRLCGGRVIA